MTRSIGAGLRGWEGQRDRKRAMERRRMICSTVVDETCVDWEIARRRVRGIVIDGWRVAGDGRKSQHSFETS